MFKHSINFLTESSKTVLLLWIFFLLFVCCVCLCHTVFSAFCSLWSPAEKGLSSWLSCMWVFLSFATFSYGVLGQIGGQVCYLIVSIPDLCLLSYFAGVLTWGCANFAQRCGQSDYRRIPQDTTGYHRIPKML